MSTCILCRLYGRAPAQPERGRVCDTDRTRAAAITARLVELAATVTSTSGLTPVRRGGGHRTPGARSTTTPVRLDVLSAIGPGARLAARDGDQVGGLPAHMALAAWCEELATWAGDPQPGTDLRAQALLLLRRLDVVLDSHPYAPQIIDQIERTVRCLDVLTGDTVRQAIGYCATILDDGAACNTRVTATVWDAAAECPRCRHRWPRSTWRGLPSTKQTAA